MVTSASTSGSGPARIRSSLATRSRRIGSSRVRRLTAGSAHTTAFSRLLLMIISTMPVSAVDN
ncbi:hypothetical protein BBK14_10260 [Parafrankia soli]|uniref:Uncharacterized protein n=1 Tax=Parafrankia soli TaxID=2599596 RepID=A0A1S1RD49_9ACTN|nr:hypothetical protein BBK14_10260 [Parafrankia soli]